MYRVFFIFWMLILSIFMLLHIVGIENMKIVADRQMIAVSIRYSLLKVLV